MPKSGVLTSLNYPDRYPDNLDSTQIIQVAEGNTIRFAWTDFNTAPDDCVRIRDENGTDLAPYPDFMSWAAQICGIKTNPPRGWGNMLPPPSISSSNVVQVKFSSNHQLAYTGWRLEWSEINNDNKNYYQSEQTTK